MHHARRAVLRSTVALAATAAAPWLGGCESFGPGDLPGSVAYRPKGVRGMALREGVWRVDLGTFVVTAVRDGFVTFPLSDSFVPEVPLAQVRQALTDAGLADTSVTIPFTAFVVEEQGRRVLLDTGNGRFGAPGTGHLVSRPQEIDIDPTSIDAVLITHFHPDHINGLRGPDGTTVFPKATIHVPKPEWDWWMDDARMRSAPPAMRDAFETTRRIFAPIAAEVRRFEPGAEVIDGIESIPAFGHTPGHSGFGFEARGHRFAYLGDLANIPALFLRHPDWAVSFDMDAETARRTRRRLLDEAVAKGWIVAGAHWPGAAVGRVTRNGNGYAFSPLAA